eukprot:CAMPEP_0115058690 /NCGR_PEP_ID=MMETSP0227-20121206/6493_1 /TAXON_ID=89957 /ORGANISM="Polarella glacialis, Strain CCMP 1383" /LENGTH=71 /DNA_ID=CAMNT_0002443711 /DNA_START=51 /DNA_END=266 /DNA_ORIENTATION=-
MGNGPCAGNRKSEMMTDAAGTPYEAKISDSVYNRDSLFNGNYKVEMGYVGDASSWLPQKPMPIVRTKNACC